MMKFYVSILCNEKGTICSNKSISTETYHWIGVNSIKRKFNYASPDLEFHLTHTKCNRNQIKQEFQLLTQQKVYNTQLVIVQMLFFLLYFIFAHLLKLNSQYFPMSSACLNERHVRNCCHSLSLQFLFVITYFAVDGSFLCNYVLLKLWKLLQHEKRMKICQFLCPFHSLKSKCWTDVPKETVQFGNFQN